MKFTQNVTQNGLLGGIAAVILTFAYYFMDVKLLFHPVWAFLPYFTIFPLFMTLAAIADRKENGGHITLLEAFKTAFFTGAIALFISTLFVFLLQTVIDPSLEVVAKESTKETTLAMLEMFGGDNIPEAEMDKALEDLETRSYKPEIGGTLVSYLVMAILGALPALLIGAIVKKNEDNLLIQGGDEVSA